MLTWNVRHLHDDRAAVVRVLRDAAPDVVCIQEAPRLPSSRLRLRALARDAGLRYLAGGRSGGGTAMLCSPRVQVGEVLAFRFPLHHLGAQRRGAVLATVGLVGSALVRVACVHLGLDPLERLAHVATLVERLAEARVPVLVAGDLNEPPDGACWRAFAPVAADPAPDAGPTFSTARPRTRIDAVLTGPGIRTLEYGRWKPDPDDARRATDHFPVLAVITPKPSR